MIAGSSRSQCEGLGFVAEPAVLGDDFIENSSVKNDHSAVGPHCAPTDILNRTDLGKIGDLNISVGSALFIKDLDAHPFRLKALLVIRVDLSFQDHGG